MLTGIFFKGLFISFLGSVPLGNINITALQIAAKENVKQAILFAVGAVLVEVTYLMLTLLLLHHILADKELFSYIHYTVIIFMFILAGISFWAAHKAKKSNHETIISTKINRFVFGMVISGLNPIQIPFWAGWAAYLFSMHWLMPDNIQYNTFTAGAGTGTFIALLLFIFLGKMFSSFIERHTRHVYLFMGILFAGMAIFRLVKMCV